MAEDIEELVVRLRPAGADETSDALDAVDERFQDTAETAADASEILSDFAEQMDGAMAVIVTALATASAGLLSQVPVISEAAQGLMAIVDAIALKMDQVLRPVLGPVTQAFYGLADAIFQAQGPMGALVGIAATVISVLTLVAGAAASVGFYLGGLSGAMSALGSVAGAITGALQWFVSGLASLVSGSLAAAAAIGAFIGTLGVAVLEISGVLDAVGRLGRMVGEALPAWARDGLLAFLSPFLSVLTVIGAAVTGFVDGVLRGGLQAGIAEAVDRVGQALDIFAGAWGRTFDRIADLVRSGAETVSSIISDLVAGVKRMLNDLLSGIESAINDAASAASAIPGAPNFGSVDIGQLATGGINVPDFSSGQQSGAGSGGGGGVGQSVSNQLDQLIGEMQNTEISIPVEIDGRQAAEATSQFLGNGATNAGRSGSR